MSIAYIYLTRRGPLPLVAEVPAKSKEEGQTLVRRDMPRHEVEGTSWIFAPDMEADVDL